MSPDPAATVQIKAVSGTGFRRLFLCLDGSAAAEASLPLALYLAKVDQARITLLRVLDSQTQSGPGDARAPDAPDALEWEMRRREALAYLEPLVEDAAAAGIETDSHLAEGLAPRRVAALASEFGADLVIVSTHGEGGADSWALGSTVRKILDSAPGPVLVVPSGVRGRAPRVPPRRILVPLDGSIRAECALPTAIRLGRATDVEVILGHVISNPIRTEVLSIEEDLALARQLSDRLSARAHMYLERIRGQLERAGVRARVSVTHSDDHREGLIALAAAEQVDLIIPSAHGCRCNPRTRFGSMTNYLFTHASVPVLAIQDLRPEDLSEPVAPRPLTPPRPSGEAP